MFDLENTLFLSDLDGTLLRGDQKISAYTAQVIPALIEKGMHFPMRRPVRAIRPFARPTCRSVCRLSSITARP